VSVAAQLNFVRALYASRRISTQEYVFFAASPLEALHDDRWLKKRYDDELTPIVTSIDAIRETHGLTRDEEWLPGEKPPECFRLEDEYTSILNLHFARTLREFRLDDLADLYEHNRHEFDRLRERGRRSTFHADELVPALRDIVVRYEEDARRAAAAGAYSAAVTLLAAGLEGLLVLRCLRSRNKATKVAQRLASRQRLRSLDDPTKWHFDRLIEVCLSAGWLPPVSTLVAQYSPARLAHLLRILRNHVHPGKHARERPWLETDEQDYKDAEAIYLVLLSTLGRVPRPRRHNSPPTP
jgi:hypothetical protein